MGWQDAPLADDQPASEFTNAPEVSAGPMAGLPPINQNREGGRFDRAMAGLKLTQEGKVGYLEDRYGKGNVATDKDGAIYIKDKGEFIPFDSPNFNTKDLYDFSGAAVAATPAIAGEAAAGALAPSLLGALGRGGLYSAMGSVTQQGMAAALPGGDPMTMGERAGQTAMDAAFGSGGEMASRLINRAGSGVRNTYLKQMGKAETPVAREGDDISNYLRQGYNPTRDGPMDPGLTPGQRSQRKGILTLEGALRRSPTQAADIFQAKDEAQLLAARRRFDDTMNIVSRNPRNGAMMGGQIAKAFDDTVSSAMNVLDKQAAADFGALDNAAGRAPVFRLNNTTAALDDLISKYDVPGAMTDTTKSVVRQLGGLRDALVRDGAPVPKSALEMQRLLSSYGRASAGSQTLFGDLDKREAMGIAKRVFSSLNKDLDDAATAGGPDSPVAQALRTARDNYRNNFAAIDELKKSNVGRLLGFTDAQSMVPEKVADAIAGYKPTQLRQTFDLLSKADPDLAGDTKRYLLERALETAQPVDEVIEQRLTGGMKPDMAAQFSPAKLLTNLSKSSVLEVLTPEEQFGVRQLTAAMQRLSNRGGTEGSPTAGLMYAMDMAKNLVSAGVAMDVVGGAKLAMSVFAPKVLAEKLTSPDALKALVTLTQPNGKREAMTAAAATLGLVAANRGAQAGEDVRPFAELARPPMPAAPAIPPLR